MDERFWMVWREGGTTPTHRHHSEPDAIREARRLAGLHVGQRFYVLEATSYARRVEPVEFVKLPLEMPF